MSQSSTSHLIEMANQIALNLSHGTEYLEIALVALEDPQIHQRVNIAVTQLSDYSAPT
jgi:ABC-type uncharacterized transport system ATPase subunit